MNAFMHSTQLWGNMASHTQFQCSTTLEQHISSRRGLSWMGQRQNAFSSNVRALMTTWRVSSLWRTANGMWMAKTPQRTTGMTWDLMASTTKPLRNGWKCKHSPVEASALSLIWLYRQPKGDKQMDLIAELAKHNKKIEDITRVYTGLDNCCRCGCRGTYPGVCRRGTFQHRNDWFCNWLCGNDDFRCCSWLEE